MALAGALCCVLQALTGFTSKSLRRLVAEYLGRPYTQAQMSYDLRRLHLPPRKRASSYIARGTAHLCPSEHVGAAGAYG
jgi:hypothetical protein